MGRLWRARPAQALATLREGRPVRARERQQRNGASAKTILTEEGEIEIAVPRGRAGSFEPQLIAKGQTRFDGFEEKILSLYARGITVREIQAHLAELYATDVSPDLISRVTDAVLDEVREWQNRPLDPVYPATPSGSSANASAGASSHA